MRPTSACPSSENVPSSPILPSTAKRLPVQESSAAVCQGGLHGIRIGVIRIVHYQNAVGPGAVEPAARELSPVEAGDDLLLRKTCHPAGGGGQKRIGHHVAAVDGQFHHLPAEIRNGKGETRPILRGDRVSARTVPESMPHSMHAARVDRRIISA